jgi:phenylalanyl-tRNA synthetase beta chain
MLLTLQYLQSLFGVKNTAEQLGEILTSHGLEVERIWSMQPDHQLDVVRVQNQLSSDLYEGLLENGATIKFKTSSTLVTNQRYVVCLMNHQWELAIPAYLGWSTLVTPLIVPEEQTAQQAWSLSDTLIELSITPNRGDCLSYLGIARELALAERQFFDHQRFFDQWEQRYPVRWKAHTDAQAVVDNTMCTSYALAQVQFNAPLPTPFWLECFLIKHGIASKHPVVDMTNYLMLVFGQPTHAFDRARIKYPLSVQHYPSSDKKLTLLTGKTVTLSAPTAVIAHHDDIYALAGLMGAQEGSVDQSTRSVLIESACFVPKAVRSMRFVGLTTDASARFERGVDRHYQQQMLRLLCGLIQSLDASVECFEPKIFERDVTPAVHIQLTQHDINKLIGAPIDIKQTQEIIKALGGSHDGVNIAWNAPSWRYDLSLKQDVIEEVVRLYGLDRLPFTLSRQKQTPIALKTHIDPWIRLGFNEVVTYSFISKRHADLFTAKPLIELSNPMTQDMAVMRPTLWPSLLSVAALNARFGERGVQLVEHAPIYGEHLADRQRFVVAALLMIEKHQRAWHINQKTTQTDFYEVKGLLEQLLAQHSDLEFEKTVHYPGLHPQLQMCIKVKGEVKGVFGQLHPVLSHQEEWPMSWLIECDADLMEKDAIKTFKHFSRMPKISRDLALIVPQSISVMSIIKFIENNQSQALQSVQVFDYYKGDHVAEGFISLGVELVFQHPTKTLEEVEIGRYVQDILSKLKHEYDVILRD